MSYCVNCGVELDKTAEVCPLCHIGVSNPSQPVDSLSPKPFPTDRREVPPASKEALALLISSMLASAALCCGVLNIFLRTGHIWSLYIIGAAVMLWVWLVPPLIFRSMPLWFQLLLDAAAIGVYILLICIDLHGFDWYINLALPIIGLLCIIMLFLVYTMHNRGRGILLGIMFVVLSCGIFVIGLEFLCDMYFEGQWQPGWSLILFTICIALLVPLFVIRRVPSLREEVRRRFHM